jgi:hypothetical protein
MKKYIIKIKNFYFNKDNSFKLASFSKTIFYAGIISILMMPQYAYYWKR